MIRINLLPVREARRKANLRQQGGLLAAAVLAGLAASAMLHVRIVASISSERTRVAAAEKELAELEKTLKEVERFRKEKEEIERKLAVIDRLERSRTGPVRILDEVATRMPERMWLTDMKLSGGELSLGGYGIDNETIAAFLTSLEDSEFISNVQLEKTELQENKGLKLNEFRIKARDATVVQTAAATPSGKKSKGGKKRGKKK
jgi:type IV pilus assembly protein PilN